MTFSISDPRWKAALAAVMLFGLGAIVGMAAERWRLRGTPEVVAQPLTVGAMADALDLDSTQRARVAALVDSLEVNVAMAAAEGAASLQTAAQDARQRLEQAIPPDRRDRFQTWMGEHHDRMMHHMRSNEMMDEMPMMGPGMMRDRMRSDEERWDSREHQGERHKGRYREH